MAATCLYCGGRIGFFGKKLYLYPGNKKGSLSIGEEKISCKKCFEKKFPPTDKQKKKLILQNFVEVQSLFERGDCKAALKKLEYCADEKSPEYWHYKGIIFLKMKKHGNALKCFEEALFLDSHSAVSWYRQGQAFFGRALMEDQGKDVFENAIKCFENVMELQPRKESFRDNWHMAAKYGRMLTLILFHQNLIDKKKPSPHINKRMNAAITDIYPFLENEVLAYHNYAHSNMSLLEAIEDQLARMGDPRRAGEDFINKCVYGFYVVFSFLEPLKYHHPLLGERH